MPRPTLRSIARESGLSLAAVSYALRDDARLPESTRERVKAIALRLGYRADPRITTVMSCMRSARKRQDAESIALVWPSARRKLAEVDQLTKRVRQGVQDRAAEFGFRVQEFWPSDQGYTAARLFQVLHARGIVGVVFAHSREPLPGIELENLNRFSLVKIGLAPWPVSLHRAAHHHYLGMQRTLQAVRAQGYSRPAAVLNEWTNQINFHAYEGSFIANHPSRRAALGLLCPTHRGSNLDLAQWLRKVQADCVIMEMDGIDRRTLPTLDFPWATLSHTGDPGIAGLDQSFAHIASNAVDLLIGQLNRNERGQAAVPKLMLFGGVWVPGASLPPKAPFTLRPASAKGRRS